MERKTLFEDDLTQARMPTPAQREETEHTIAMDPDVAEDDEEDDDEDEDLDE